jgi:hypothetical protein
MLDDTVTIQRQVVAITAVIGGLLGLLLAYMANHSWLHRFANKLDISKKFAEVDVWTHLMTYQGPQWVVIRDHSKNLMYQGPSLTIRKSLEAQHSQVGKMKRFDLVEVYS